jgi:hypothetical protein
MVITDFRSNLLKFINNYNSEGDMIMNDLHSVLKTTIVKGLSEGGINSFFRIKPIKTSTWVLFIHLDI